jgi:hypothetical protein
MTTTIAQSGPGRNADRRAGGGHVGSEHGQSDPHRGGRARRADRGAGVPRRPGPGRRRRSWALGQLSRRSGRLRLHHHGADFVEVKPTGWRGPAGGVAVEEGRRQPRRWSIWPSRSSWWGSHALLHTGEAAPVRRPEDGSVHLYARVHGRRSGCSPARPARPEGRITLAVTAPPGWQVAGNAVGTEVAPGRWEFATTDRSRHT